MVCLHAANDAGFRSPRRPRKNKFLSLDDMRMSAHRLTITIPTRDRPDLLEKCLESVYTRQTTIPNVIVSDNSTKDHPITDTFRRRYGFRYVRQSGQLSQTAHINVCCLDLPDTPWVLVLHDDDELYPECLGNLQTFLAACGSIGVVVAGIQFIDFDGAVYKEWTPAADGFLRGEEALLRLGLNWGVRPPGMILNVAACRRIGGFLDIRGTSADYTLAVQLAYAVGVAFFPALVGRYRQGPQQMTDFSTPEKSSAWLDFSIQLAQRAAPPGCSRDAAEQLIDYMTWWTFLGIASRWFSSHPSLVVRLAHEGLSRSPRCRTWQTRVRREYPFLYWRPPWLAWRLCRLARRLRRVASTGR
jgi:glycosyltransferase involved in cell wall biosynthesis